jgi:hypothetical protein
MDGDSVLDGGLRLSSFKCNRKMGRGPPGTTHMTLKKKLPGVSWDGIPRLVVKYSSVLFFAVPVLVVV